MNSLISKQAVRSPADPSDPENADLTRRIELFLASRPWPALRRLRIDSDRGAVRVSGQVGTFHEKQIAQQCVLRVAGVRQLIDEVHVVDARPRIEDPWLDSALFHAWSDHGGIGA